MAWLAAYATAAGADTACGSLASMAGSSPFSQSGPPDFGWRSESASSSRSSPSRCRTTKRAIGLSSDSAAGRGRGRPLSLATQNTQGLSEAKLSWLVEQKHDILAMTENHGDLADSKLAAELGNSIISCGKTGKEDPAAGVALLLSERVAAAVVDKGHVGSRICWARKGMAG